MSSGKSQYLSQKLLNQIFGGTAYTFATTLYFALYTVSPGAGNSGTEATGTGYARVAVVCNTTNWPAISGSSQTITNGTAINFPTATGNWSSSSNQVTAGILDASSAGNLLYFGDLTTAKPVLNGDTASFAASAVTVQET